jgi:hypothetical protein
MRLVLCRSVWGLEADPGRWPAVLPDIARRGFDAVSLPIQQVDVGQLTVARDEAGLDLVAQVFTFGRSVEDHLAMLRQGLELAAVAGARHAVVQGGRDGWPLADAVRFLRAADDASRATGVPAVHETHRSRILFNPWVTERILDELPGLRIAADLSHWTCVGETMRLPDRIVTAVAAATHHVDARVGWEQGPQVADPRTPAHAAHVEAFERWWDVIWSTRAATGAGELVVQPEFGPPPYQPVHPATGEPLADVNAVNDWMGRRLRSRYDKGLPAEPTSR